MRPGEFAKRERSILKRLSGEVRKLVAREGVPVGDKQVDAFALLLFPILELFRRQMYLLAVEEITQQSEALGVRIPVAPERRYTVQATREMVAKVTDASSPVGGRVVVDALDAETQKVTKTRVVVDESNRKDPVVVKQVTDRLIRGAQHHTQSAGRDALMDTAEQASEFNNVGENQRDGVKLGYARVLTGSENCSFCAMLASRGPVYDNFESAGGLKAFHYGCDCVVRLVFEDEPWEGMEEWQALADLWYEDTQDDKGRSLSAGDARRAFRRNWERRKRENGGAVSTDFIAPSFRGG